VCSPSQEDEAKRKGAAEEKKDSDGGIRLGRLKKSGPDGRSGKGSMVFGEVSPLSWWMIKRVVEWIL